MLRTRSSSLRTALRGGVAAAALAGLLLAGGAVRAEPEDAQPGEAKPAKGSAYRNRELGVSAESPVGWQMVVDKGAKAMTWKRLVTFNDRATDAQVTLSVRPRTAPSVEALKASSRRAWEKSRGRLRLDSMKTVEPNPLAPIGKVIVEGSFTRDPKPKPAKDGVAPLPAPPIAYRVQATYILGPGYEYLLYAQGQRTHWSRLSGPLRKLADSVRFTRSEKAGAKGAGTYRSDAHGFSCQFPKDYTVVTPQRANHVVGFEGVGDSDAVLGIYVFSWTKSADADAQRLVTHYEEDKGGTVSVGSREVSGQEAVFITAEANLGGMDRTILLAILKRGETCFRLRASVPTADAARGTAVFETFLSQFRMHSSPK